eukprot:2988288-Alexandrium_andersonii.AAC.1
MSASLVGSEMCIRDRSRKGQGLFAGLHVLERGRGSARTPRRLAVTPQKTCLLYTSDAADDM